MDYNDNQESTGLISNQALNRGQVVIGTRDVITGNDVINNRPIEFNATRTMDQFFNCDNKQPSDVSQNNGLALEGDSTTNVLSFNRTQQDGYLPEAAKNGRTSWHELSPKKEKKCYSGDSSGSASGSGSFSTASSSSRSSPSKSWKGSLEKGANKNQVMTWRDVSPTKAERGPLGSTSPQSPVRSPERPLSRQQLHRQPLSPEHGCARHRTPGQGHYNYNEVYKVQSSPEHGPETFPPASPSLGNQVDDQINNDYFYDEDFTVQFDTNLRESSPGLNCTCVDPSLMIGFPHTVTGSYLNFNNTKGTNFINQNSTELFCPDESELSYSRNSAMDVSTSEREMMCSSDMLDFSDNPLFTPSPTHDVQTTTANTLTNENVMTDSLDKVTKDHLRLGQNMELSSSQTSSSDMNFCVNCCPRKDEYFLSFVGSQGSKGSASDNENSVTSVDSGQGHWSNQQNTVNHGSACSTEDGGEESSDSFHFSYSGNGSGGKNKTSIASKGQRFSALGALQETSMEHSISSEDSVTLDRPSNVRRDLRLHCSAHAHTFPRNQCGNATSRLPLVMSPKKKAHHFISNGNSSSKSNTSNSRHRSKKVTSWRQVKSLRKLGRLENVLDPSRSTSMPDLQQNWQSLSSYDLQKIAESFHSKRHSAYLLDLYQRVKNQSNPVSPETMANIEHILFQPNITNHGHNPQVDHGSLQKAHTDTGRDDSYSDHTLTNSHAHFTSSTQQPMEYSTRKRILEWLEKEKFEGTNRAKGSQTEVAHSTKETIVSPTTVTLWCGTRNFGSQFPPSMKDCAIQTSVEEMPRRQKVCCHDTGQQTSPMSDRSQLLSLLPEKFNELEEIFPIKQEMIEETEIKSKLVLPRSKSADSARTKKPDSAENSPKNTFYSHKSLPDLSFLKATPLTPDSDNFSLFDPLPNDTPLPVYVQTEEYAHTQETIRNKVASHSHHTRKEAEPHSGANYKRSRSAPPRTVNPNIPRNCAESGSSSSGFSTSSTSSGIDPGYSEPRSYHNGSPSNDIERLLFYPPHVESTAKKCDVCKSEPSDPGISEMMPVAANNQQIVPMNIQVPISVQQQLVVANVQDITKIPLVRHSPDKRINRYTNEVHPGVIDVRHRARTPPIKCPTNNSGLGSAGNSTNSSQTFLEHLYALQEENTPVSSPERSASPYGFHYDINGIPCYRGESCTCCLATIDLDAESLQEWHRDQLILRRRLDCQIQLSSESGSSSSSSLIPNIDKKPLKSCLRKKQVIRSRSVSEPYGLLQQIEGQRKQHARKVNRHSYACEEVYLLRDETGEYYLCENKDETEEEEMEDEEVDDDKDDDDKDREVGMFYLEDDSNTQTVRRRQKKDKKPPVEEKKDNADDSSDKELSGKRKSVSFASEVSFHAISPQDSPKRRDRQPDDDEEEEEEKKEEPKVVEVKPVTESKTQVSAESVPKPVTTQSSVTSIGSCDSDGGPPAEFLLSPPTEMPESYPTGPEVDRRQVLLQDVGSAAEALVKHFAKAKNPFDKLRLGSSADTPEIGELVLSTLCPAVNKVVSDGLKTYLAGVQVFGRVQVTVWKLTEASAEQGPYTRAIYELVQQLKTHSGLTTHNHKFDAFILGLLNLRLLDYWVGYLRHSDFITEKYYNQEAVIILGKTVHQREFDEMLTALQELAVLPFQLNFDLVVEKCPKTKTSPVHSPTRLSPIGSPTSSKSLTKDDKGSPPAKPPRRASTGITTGLTTTAWNWLKGGTTEPVEASVDSNHGSSMISSLTNMLGNWRGRDYNNKADVTTKEATPICHSNDQPTDAERHKITDKVAPKHLPCETPAEVDVKKNVSQMNVNITENTDAASKNISPKSSPVKKAAENTTKTPTLKEQETSPNHKGNKDGHEKMSQSQEKSMMDSVTGITQKLLGIAPPAKEKAAYKKGVTDYDFGTEKAEEKTKKERSPENSISRIPVPSSRSTHQKIDTSGSKEKTPENSVTEKNDSKQQASTTSAASSSSQEERPKNLKLRRPPTTNTGKSKSGLIKLFDKLLLPKDSVSSSQKSQAQKSKNRWSWGAGHNVGGASDTVKPGAGARPKSVCIPKQESTAPPRHVCHSAIPAPTKKKSTTASAKDNKEVSKNVKASPANSIDPQRKLGGQENDQVKVKMSQSGDPKGDNSKPSVLNKDDPKRDQSLLVQLDKSGEAKLQQTFHVDDKGEANLRQRVELDKSGQSRDQKITVQIDKSTQVKLQQTVELNQTGEAKLHQTVEVDDENKNKKDSSKTEMKPIRNSWKAVERGPTLILPTTCKFLDNIEERKKNNDPESPKRRKNESPKRSPSSRPSPANSPKSPRSKSGKRWSLYNPGSKKDELVDLDINSNSAEPSQHAKSAPTTPVKTKATKIDQSPSRKAGCKGEGAKNKKTEKKLDNAAKKKDSAEKEEEKRDLGAEKRKEPECFFYKPKFRYIKTVKKFESTDPGYLSFEEGEYFEVLAQVDAVRLFCVNGKKEGLIQIEAVKSMTDRDEFDTLHDNFYQ